MPSLIGLWVFRPSRRAHLVESEIEDRLITRCGRTLSPRSYWQVLQVEPTWSSPACLQCRPKIG